MRRTACLLVARDRPRGSTAQGRRLVTASGEWRSDARRDRGQATTVAAAWEVIAISAAILGGDHPVGMRSGRGRRSVTATGGGTAAWPRARCAAAVRRRSVRRSGGGRAPRGRALQGLPSVAKELVQVLAESTEHACSIATRGFDAETASSSDPAARPAAVEIGIGSHEPRPHARTARPHGERGGAGLHASATASRRRRGGSPSSWRAPTRPRQVLDGVAARDRSRAGGAGVDVPLRGSPALSDATVGRSSRGSTRRWSRWRSSARRRSARSSRGGVEPARHPRERGGRACRRSRRRDRGRRRVLEESMRQLN